MTKPKPKPSNCSARTHTHTHWLTHSHTHTQQTACWACLHSAPALQHVCCPLLCLSLSLCRCRCRCSLCLRLHFIQFLRGCCCCCTSDAAFVAVDANNRSTQTGACRGVKRKRGRECRQNNMFVWIISYVALRSLRRCFVCANNWSRRKLHGGDCSDGGGIDSAEESGEWQAGVLFAVSQHLESFSPAAFFALLLLSPWLTVSWLEKWFNQKESLPLSLSRMCNIWPTAPLSSPPPYYSRPHQSTWDSPECASRILQAAVSRRRRSWSAAKWPLQLSDRGARAFFLASLSLSNSSSSFYFQLSADYQHSDKTISPHLRVQAKSAVPTIGQKSWTVPLEFPERIFKFHAWNTKIKIILHIFYKYDKFYSNWVCNKQVMLTLK